MTYIDLDPYFFKSTSSNGSKDKCAWVFYHWKAHFGHGNNFLNGRKKSLS